MAIPRLSVKAGKSGGSTSHAEYIAREGKYTAEHSNDEAVYTEHGNMPSWAEHDPSTFWKAADQHERANGSPYREWVIALPRELTAEQRVELIKDFVKEEIGDKYPYQLAIHNPKAMDGGEQPHCHLMFNERRQDGIQRDPDQYFKRANTKNPEKGGCKKDNTGIDHATRKGQIKELRQRWEEKCNQHLERAGSKERIDMRSYREQGIEKTPERKYLPSEARDPQKRGELIMFRDARKDAQNRAVEPQEVKQGVNTTMQRFEAYKREQARKEQERQVAEKLAAIDRAAAEKQARIEKALEIQKARAAKTKDDNERGYSR